MEKNEHREERLIVGVRGEVADKYNKPECYQKCLGGY